MINERDIIYPFIDLPSYISLVTDIIVSFFFLTNICYSDFLKKKVFDNGL